MSVMDIWAGYSKDFLEGFSIPLPVLNTDQQNDISQNVVNGEDEFKYIYYSAIHSKSRKMPYYTAGNIYREFWLQGGRVGTFVPDKRLPKEDQLSTVIYSQLNKRHSDKNKKIDKGHLTRREDVQWDEDGNTDKAVQAAKATFFYTNACPQHHQLNNEIWKYLEDAILIRGHSRKPLKATVFTGPIFNESDPLLVFPEGVNYQIKCPLRFWKVIYYVNDKNTLRCAAFIMSHKQLMERDGYIQTDVSTRDLKASGKKDEIPFLMFEENEKYQIKMSLLEKLTGLKFENAAEGLSKNQVYSKLSFKPSQGSRDMKSNQDSLPIDIQGLYP